MILKKRKRHMKDND